MITGATENTRHRWYNKKLQTIETLEVYSDIGNDRTITTLERFKEGRYQRFSKKVTFVGLKTDYYKEGKWEELSQQEYDEEMAFYLPKLKKLNYDAKHKIWSLPYEPKN